ncbi:chemotaxis protein CheW [Candidatus Magnetominusculus xianensis]|uniref:Chemotaxis protein CheW n=1 Tax=Candidatus Magnetominusculus xianensis TaxID=1748249 RepID=A0ABR5SI00_9BACT|nr:chemotaxis protein CheW [Candidatus Magnetominusculus xianensis]KWT90167.1 chemotaxis protein CheW [Candidatus Magnetominusculus xianensis]MBF0403660.1 chemotaxis protein CheW [Nitrospirota bacterium]
MFRIGRFVYAVPVIEVREIIHLPEFRQVDEAPAHIAGLVSIRGTVVPLVDIDVRFGRPQSARYLTTDKVVVFHCDGAPTGIIINEVIDIYEIPPDSIVDTPAYGRSSASASVFIEQVAKIDEAIIMILNQKRLFDSSYKPAVEDLNSASDAEHFSCHTSFNTLTHETDKSVFHKRALDLASSDSRDDEEDDRMPLAVIETGGELFGIELEVVREFININDYRQVPCCPSHIVGNINLRGEILTLIDITGVLSLTRGNIKSAVVVSIDGFTVGICIDNLIDIMYLPFSGFKELPAALGQTSEDYFEFTALYEGRAVVVINIQSILYKGNLIVNEVL